MELNLKLRQMSIYLKKHSVEFIDKIIKQELSDEDFKALRDPKYVQGNIIEYSIYNSQNGHVSHKKNRIYMSGIEFNIFRLKNHLDAYINSDAITSYFMPYIFSLLAVASAFIGIYND